MRDILDALESIHTNKKKPMDVKKELNKKPAVMKALSLEDTETNEDKFDGYKIHRLAELQKKVDDVAKDIRLLGKTDAMPDATGAGDLTDQITTMNKAVMMLQDVIERANSIVPDPLKNYDGTPKTEESQVDEGGVKRAMEADAENMSKEEFIAKHGEENADFYDNYNGTEDETINSEEQEMETTKKDTVEVAVEDLARVLELAGLGKEVIKAEAEAEQQAEAEAEAEEEQQAEAEAEATEEATTEAPNEVELDEYSNSPDEDYFDADTQLNKLSGGLNGPKKQLKKEYPGDNPLAVDLETKLAKMLSDM